MTTNIVQLRQRENSDDKCKPKDSAATAHTKLDGPYPRVLDAG